MSAYAPETGCGENEKIKFWEEMDEGLRDIPDTEKLWVGGDFNGHCGRNKSGKEETIGKYGVGESNEAAYNFVAFAMSHNMRVVNTYFEKAKRHKITYKSRTAESGVKMNVPIFSAVREISRSFEILTPKTLNPRVGCGFKKMYLLSGQFHISRTFELLTP